MKAQGRLAFTKMLQLHFLVCSYLCSKAETRLSSHSHRICLGQKLFHLLFQTLIFVTQFQYPIVVNRLYIFSCNHILETFSLFFAKIWCWIWKISNKGIKFVFMRDTLCLCHFWIHYLTPRSRKVWQNVQSECWH